MSSYHRLALGTVQFGIPYGIANKTGQVSRDQAKAILNLASAEGLDTLDTAIAYGESEQLLGEIGVGQWKVISKLPAIPETGTNVAAWALESALATLKRLGISKLRALLLHHSQDLLGPHGDALYRAMANMKNQGMVEKIGVSIYDPEELDILCPRFQFDLVQAPFNIVDRRLFTSGWLARLHRTGTEVHSRSLFLQGLLLMSREKMPAAFHRWQSLWNQWHRWLNDHSMSPLQACLGFAMSQSAIDRVVVGVDSVNQLREILACVEAPAVILPETLMSGDLDLIDPSRWH